MSAVRIAIVVPTKDATSEMARTCLDAARKTTEHLGATVHPIQRSGPGFRFSRSINEGIRKAPDADGWVLLNDDAWMDAGWLDAMLDAAAAHPEVGEWGGLLRYPDGSIQHAGGYVHTSPLPALALATRHKAPLWMARMIASQRGRAYPYMWGHWRSISPRHRLDYVTAACALVTRACVEKVGLFDEDYEFGAEDVDYSLRALEAGLEIGVARGATGLHHEGKSTAPMGERQRRSLNTFRAKWPAARIRAATRGRHGVIA
ncbi:MAG: hypothetical protein QOE90_1635 [Thermoplasmata archaeon]|nr:hypothetical protein [Thermoplasmata archaeon]